MPSVGVDRNTGGIITGWARTSQSLATLVTTELRSRVERRDLGSNIPNLIDRPQSEEAVIDFYMAIAEAIEPRLVNGHIYGEPCFEVSELSIDMRTPGSPVIGITGVEYPDGHLGDFTKPKQRSLKLSDYL